MAVGGNEGSRQVRLRTEKWYRHQGAGSHVEGDKREQIPEYKKGENRIVTKQFQLLSSQLFSHFHRNSS